MLEKIETKPKKKIRILARRQLQIRSRTENRNIFQDFPWALPPAATYKKNRSSYRTESDKIKTEKL